MYSCESISAMLLLIFSSCLEQPWGLCIVFIHYCIVCCLKHLKNFQSKAGAYVWYCCNIIKCTYATDPNTTLFELNFIVCSFEKPHAVLRLTENFRRKEALEIILTRLHIGLLSSISLRIPQTVLSIHS